MRFPATDSGNPRLEGPIRDVYGAVVDREHSAAGARGNRWRLFVAPALVFLSVGIWAYSDQQVFIGPFDRAKIGWALVVPLFLLAPGAAALAGRAVGRETAVRALVFLSVGIAAAVVVALTATVGFLDCRPVTDRIDVAYRSIPLGIACGGGFAGAGLAGLAALDRFGPIGALLASASTAILAGIIALLVFAATFPALSCAAPISG